MDALRKFAVLAVALGICGVSAEGAAASTWPVNTTSDAAAAGSECQGVAGDCSLRQAIDKAGAGDTVTLAASATAYAVTLGRLTVDKSLTISGAGARTTRIEGDGSSGIFDISAPAAATVTISGMAVENGNSAASGGAMQIASPGATVELETVTLSDNTAATSGGAIELTGGTLNVTAATIGPGNAGGGNGGGIDNNGGTLTLTNSTVSGNSVTGGGKGGGLSTEGGGTTALHSATIAFNSASGAGAAGGNLYSANPGNVPVGFSIADSIVADGAAPSGGDCNGNSGFGSTGHNVTDGISSTGVATCGFTQASDLLGDARLGPLEDNGGQTQTEALGEGSPATDQVPTSDPSCSLGASDQRGVARPVGLACDSGALEAGGGETAPQWNASHDFRTSPQANPSQDSFSNSGVWSYEEAPVANLHQPANYTLMTASGVAGGCSNLYIWGDPGGLPDTPFNAGSGTDVCFGSVTFPGFTQAMHPGGGAFSIIGWTSPVSGAIDVAGSFTSLDPNGGSGTTWYVDKGSANLAAGVNPVGGAGNFELRSLAVSQGDVLYFILGPAANADITYDTTALGLTITQAAPASADVRLAATAAPDPVTVGGDLTDTFTVANDGPAQADGISLSDPLPAGATLQSASASQGSCTGTTTLTCTLGTLASGASATVTVALQPTQAGTIANTASVSATTADSNPANNSATATAEAVTPAAGCSTSMVIDAVEVLADCISAQDGDTFLAGGHTRFSDGTSIVAADTGAPAALVIDPAAHTVSLAPASGGGPQTGRLLANGVDVATGRFVVGTQGAADPVSGVAASAPVTGIDSVDVALSGWSFANLGVAPTVYLAPGGARGGALVDGQLALPAWLGPLLNFGPLGAGFTTSVSGQLAVQVDSAGNVSVVNGGISFARTLLGIPALKLEKAQIQYQRAGDVWSGTATLGTPNLLGLTVNAVIGQGKLVSLDAFFACSESGHCAGPAVQSPTAGAPPVTGPKPPTLGAVLDIKDVALHLINPQSVSYTPPSLGSSPTRGTITVACNPRLKPCPAPQPPPQINGSVIVGALGDHVIAGGGFTYLFDGSFSADGSVGLAPLYGGKFPAPAALQKNTSAANVVKQLMKSAHTGVELANAQVKFTPPHLLQASGNVFLPPPPFPLQFLKGSMSIGIDPPHFTGQSALTMIVPQVIPLVGGKTFGGVEALVSDKGAAGKASLPRVCVKYIGCSPTISVLVAFKYQSGSFVFDVGGGSINDYATVSQAAASGAASGVRRSVRVPGGKQLASIAIRSSRGIPNVQLISPARDRHRRRLTLKSSRQLRNRSGALAWTDKASHSETFLVSLPSRGRWTVKRINGPLIRSVKVTVPRHKLGAARFPRVAPGAGDLPTRTVSTDKAIKLHYDVPGAGSGTTVDLWAGTGPHGAGGVMIAEGLPASGSATWKLDGLGSGRYWPYAIVNQKGVPVSISYWPDSVDVADPAAPVAPTGVDAALNSGQAYAFWHEVPAAETYAITATPVAGGESVRDAVPATQLADQLDLAAGKWSVTVQAVDADGLASLPSAPARVTVPR